MQKFVGTSLKTRLYLLVLAAFVPVTALIFYIAEEHKAIETEAILQKTMLMTQSIAYEESQQLESSRNLLTAVTEAFLMVERRADRVSGLLVNLYNKAKGYVEFGIIDPGGRLLAGSNPSKNGQDYSDKSWFVDCLRRKELTVGQFHGEAIDAEPLLYFAQPVLDQYGQTTAVGFAAVNLNWMNLAIFKQLAELPKGARLTLLDESRGMIRYQVADGRWSVPAGLEPSLRQQIVRRGSGTLTATDENKVKRLYAFSPVSSYFRNKMVSVVLDVPQEEALHASKRIFIRNVTLLALSALLSLVSIWWAGDFFILRRIQAMVLASRELAAGNLAVRIGKIGVHDEISHMAGVFDEMAAALQLRIEREKQVMSNLKQSREQFRELAAYHQEVREQERVRIAREIHDQFGQSLTILKMDLAWIKKQLSAGIPALNEKLAAMSEVIDEALKNLHSVTAELRPVMLDDFGLAAAIEWQIEDFRKRSGIECYIENGDFEPDLPKEMATALFRIFQETLTNVMRHAQADKVAVRLAACDGDLILEIQDNGRGITEAEINGPKSYGLMGMRERLRPWDGHISFEGRPGKGTCVTIRFPMPAKGEAND